MYKTTTAILIIGLLLYILYLTQCRQQKPCPQGQIFERVDTQQIINNFKSTWTKPTPDTIIKRVVKTVPGKPIPGEPIPIFMDTGRIVYLYKPIDTPALIQDYFSIRVYHDSTSFKHGKVKVTDSISQNQIMARQWEVQDTAQIITKRPRQIYIGGGGYFNLKKDTTLVPAVHVDIGYINRKGQHFKLDILRTTKDWQGGVSFYHTIRFR